MNEQNTVLYDKSLIKKQRVYGCITGFYLSKKEFLSDSNNNKSKSISLIYPQLYSRNKL